MSIEQTALRTVTVNKRVGLEIKAWLARREMRQLDLANALDLSQGAVSQRLIGNVSFSVEELVVAAGLLGVSLGEMLGADLLKQEGPRPAQRDEGQKKLPRLDSNQQPFD